MSRHPAKHDHVAPLAVIAATRGELEPLLARLEQPATLAVAGSDAAWHGRLVGRSVVLAVCGVGTVAAAGATVGIVARFEPTAVIMTGIGGAYVGAFVPVGAAIAASSEFDLDAGVATVAGRHALSTVPLARGQGSDGPLYERIATDRRWRDRLAAASGTVALPFATSDAIAGDLDTAAERALRSDASVESMEGFGAALACARLDVPFAEIRGVSNVAGVRDKQAWDIAGAVRAASTALLDAIRAASG